MVNVNRLLTKAQELLQPITGFDVVTSRDCEIADRVREALAWIAQAKAESESEGAHV